MAIYKLVLKIFFGPSIILWISFSRLVFENFVSIYIFILFNF